MLTYIFMALFIWSMGNLQKFYAADDGDKVKKWKTINTVSIVGVWLCTFLTIGVLVANQQMM